MENVNPWAVFWGAFFTALPIVITQVLAHMRQMAELRINTKMTVKTQVVAADAATRVIETADKVDSATKAQANTASAAATIAKSAAKEAKETAAEAKSTAIKTTEAVHKVSVDIADLKEAVNGYLTERMQSAHKAGYAMGINDTIVAKVDEHTNRISSIETKLDRIESKITTALDGRVV